MELYQSHTWAKFTGEADYDQAFHCDFGNHTLTVPGDESRLRTVNFVIHISDVTDVVGALHYVAKDDAAVVLGDGAVVAATEQQPALLARQRSAAAPAGSILAYGIDTFHRGTNLTDVNGFRYTMTVSFKAAGNSQDRLSCMAVCARQALALDSESWIPSAVAVSRYSAAGRSILDGKNPAAYPGALAGLGHERIPGGGRINAANVGVAYLLERCEF